PCVFIAFRTERSKFTALPSLEVNDSDSVSCIESNNRGPPSTYPIALRAGLQREQTWLAQARTWGSSNNHACALGAAGAKVRRSISDEVMGSTQIQRCTR